MSYEALNNVGAPTTGIDIDTVTDETIKAALVEQQEARDEVVKGQIVALLNENQAKIQREVVQLRENRRLEAELVKRIKRHTDAQTLAISPADGEAADFSALLVVLGHADASTLERCPPEFKKS